MKVWKLTPNAHIPIKEHENDAGYAVKACRTEVLPGPGAFSVHTGIVVTPERDVNILISSTRRMKDAGIFVQGGMIDYGYLGELIIYVIIPDSSTVRLHEGETIASLVEIPTKKGAAIGVSDETGKPIMISADK